MAGLGDVHELTFVIAAALAFRPRAAATRVQLGAFAPCDRKHRAGDRPEWPGDAACRSPARSLAPAPAALRASKL
jgi:hypothetical protein